MIKVGEEGIIKEGGEIKAKEQKEKLGFCEDTRLMLSLKIKKIADTLLHQGKTKPYRRFCVDRNSVPLCLPDPVRQMCSGRSQL